MFAAAHGKPRHDTPRPQPAANDGCVVAAIPEHTVRPLPRSPACAAQRGDRIHQRQRFLRVVPVRAGQTNRKRYAPPLADQVTLTAALGPVGGIRPGLVTPVDSADRTTVHDRPRPINLVVASEPIQKRKVDQIPDARPLPIAQAPPACHPRSAPELLREHLPGNAATKNEDNASEARTIRDTRPPTLWSSGWNRQERLDKIP